MSRTKQTAKKSSGGRVGGSKPKGKSYSPYVPPHRDSLKPEAPSSLESESPSSPKPHSTEPISTKFKLPPPHSKPPKSNTPPPAKMKSLSPKSKPETKVPKSKSPPLKTRKANSKATKEVGGRGRGRGRGRGSGGGRGHGSALMKRPPDTSTTELDPPTSMSNVENANATPSSSLFKVPPLPSDEPSIPRKTIPSDVALLTPTPPASLKEPTPIESLELADSLIHATDGATVTTQEKPSTTSSLDVVPAKPTPMETTPPSEPDVSLIQAPDGATAMTPEKPSNTLLDNENSPTLQSQSPKLLLEEMPSTPQRNLRSNTTVVAKKPKVNATRTPNKSMSFANVMRSPGQSRETVEQVLQRLCDAFSGTSEQLELLSRQFIPDIEALSSAAINFFLCIFGGPNIEQSQHASEDLFHFIPLCTSLRFAAVAQHKMKSGMYQLRLRYFAGLGEDQKQRNNPNLDVADGIRNFFNSIFEHPDKKSVEDCSRKARSLYITVRSAPNAPSKKKKQSTAKSATVCPGEPNETIVACINFCLMPGHGFFVNWLATTPTPLEKTKYGEDLLFVATDGSWLRRHFALFLLRAANLAVVSHLRLLPTPLNDYCIVLQARTVGKETAAKFYSRVGFDEVGLVDGEALLNEQVYEGFPLTLRDGKESLTDYMHFLWEYDDISIFKNSTGTFGSLTSFSRRFRNAFILMGNAARSTPPNKMFSTLDSLTSKENFTFPFAAIRNHLMILATDLDFFYLPFRQSPEEMHDFIHADRWNQYVTVTPRDRSYFMQNDGWLNDAGIDFYIRW